MNQLHETCCIRQYCSSISPSSSHTLRLPLLQSELLKLSPADINGLTETEAAFTMLLGPLSLCPSDQKVVSLGWGWESAAKGRPGYILSCEERIFRPGEGTSCHNLAKCRVSTIWEIAIKSL